MSGVQKTTSKKLINSYINFKQTILFADPSLLRRKNPNTFPIISTTKKTNLGTFYILPKIHKRFYNVPGRTRILNCGTPAVKVSEFRDFHLKPLMQIGCSYIRDSKHVIDKMKKIGKVPEGFFLVTVYVVDLYPSIPHK